uniref:Dynein light chain n=1 Tax=Rhabditophanes sp. KR3021 TaxID=114890 RepID=A0AC35TMF9_9BILA
MAQELTQLAHQCQEEFQRNALATSEVLSTAGKETAAAAQSKVDSLQPIVLGYRDFFIGIVCDISTMQPLSFVAHS